MRVNTLEMMEVFFESTMMISASATEMEELGVHEYEPLLLTWRATSVMIVVVSFAPAGTR
jgi:hypothetical protein